VEATDALAILRFIVGLPAPRIPSCPAIGELVTADNRPTFWGDVNGDGQIGADDALLILRFVVGLPIAAPVGTPVAVSQ